MEGGGGECGGAGVVEGEDGLSASGTQRSLSFPRAGSRERPSLAWVDGEEGRVRLDQWEGVTKAPCCPLSRAGTLTTVLSGKNSSNLLAVFLINTKDLQ